jgi:hypothetical protein
MKKILTAAVVAAMMTLVACGGSDKKSDSTESASGSNKALSYSEFGTQADALCAAVTADTDPIGAKITGQAATDGPVLDELIPKLKAGTEKFKTLKPPAELQDAFKTFNDVNAQQVVVVTKAQTAAKAGDQAGYMADLQELQGLSAQSDAAGSALGAPACAATP